MVFRICTMQNRTTYKSVMIPFEDRSLSTHEVWMYISKLWSDLCEKRDRFEGITQHRLSNYKLERDLKAITAEFKGSWFDPMNAIRFVRMVLEWCDEYVPEAPGLDAISKIFYSEQVCAASETSLLTKTLLRTEIGGKKASFFNIFKYQVFGYGTIRAPEYFDSNEVLYRIQEGSIIDGKALEYRLCMKRGIEEYYGNGVEAGTVPMIYLNWHIACAIFTSKQRAVDPLYFTAIPALFLTITALQKYHYGTFNDDFIDIKYFWDAMMDLSLCSTAELEESAKSLFKSCNDLQKGALVIKNSLSK